MADIRVTDEGGDRFRVTVRAARRTEHVVTLDEATWQRLSGERVDRAKLIECSFEFLLERESNTSILPNFELTLISRYFPEYKQEIARRI